MEEELLKFDAEGKLIETISGARERRRADEHFSLRSKPTKPGIAGSSVYSQSQNPDYDEYEEYDDEEEAPEEEDDETDRRTSYNQDGATSVVSIPRSIPPPPLFTEQDYLKVKGEIQGVKQMLKDLKAQIKAAPETSEDLRTAYGNALVVKDKLKERKKEIKGYLKQQRLQS